MRTRLAAVAACLVLIAYPGFASSATAQTRPAVRAADASWISRGAIYEVFVRDFSPEGTFRGVIGGLDRIKAVGANIVWLMPIYPVGVANRKGTLGSPYAVRDYRATNPEFGTAEDFRALVKAAHARGLKLILDWVPNHTAWDNVWTMSHPDYYVRNDSGGLTVPRDDKGKLTDWTDVAQLDYHNPALRRAMIEAMQYWLREFGIDGFRVDAAGFVPDDFWREAIPPLRATVPRRIVLLAEWGDLKMHRFGFDLTYSWDAYGRLKNVWGGTPASEFVRQEVADMQAMPAGGMRLRFTTNHDETAWDNPPVTRFTSPEGARAAFVAMALLPGRPLIYDGQEVESAQKLPLFEHDPIAWNQPRAAAAIAFYRKIVQLSRTDAALTAGEFAAVETSAPADVISYRRGSVVVLVNTRPRPIEVTLSGTDISRSVDIVWGRPHRGNTVSLPGFGAVVLEPRKPTRGAGH